MPEIKPTPGEIETTGEKPEEMNWRRWTAGIGIALLFVSLFAAAGAKEALGNVPKYAAFAAFLILAVSGIAGIINWMSSKGKSARGN